MIDAITIWDTFAKIAKDNNMSMWKLSQISGLSINGSAKSKQMKNTKPRYPTICTVMKVCDAVGLSLID